MINHRIQVFDKEGEFLYQWGRHPPTAHEGHGRIHYPLGISAAPDSKHAIVCEPFENRCQVFSKDRIAQARNVRRFR
jgi:hypothetical protein